MSAEPTTQVSLRLTVPEREALEGLAKRRGMALAALIKASALEALDEDRELARTARGGTR